MVTHKPDRSRAAILRLLRSRRMTLDQAGEAARHRPIMNEDAAEEELKRRLANGELIALMDAPAGPAEVPASTWLTLAFDDDFRPIGASRQHLMPLFRPASVVGLWSAVSGATQPLPEDEEVTTHSDWKLRPAESLNSWVHRSSVTQEALRRRLANPKLKSRQAAMLEMAQECGASWRLGSIRNAYRGK